MPGHEMDALIVDDHLEICELVSEYLEEMEIFRHIVHAEDGLIASSKLQNQELIIFFNFKFSREIGFYR